jgi:ABC-type enterobactin transport system permease subunit
MEKLKEVYKKVRSLPKRRLIIIGISVKVIQVAVSTYLIKKLFFSP